MNSIDSRYRLRLRIATLVTGAVCLLWLTIEDDNLVGVFTFAVLFSGLISLRLVNARARTSWKSGYLHVFVGGLGGVLVPILGLILMVLKNGMHLHAAPEYSPAQLAFVIRSTPIWIVAGAIAGAGWQLMRK